MPSITFHYIFKKSTKQVFQMLYRHRNDVDQKIFKFGFVCSLGQSYLSTITIYINMKLKRESLFSTVITTTHFCFILLAHIDFKSQAPWKCSLFLVCFWTCSLRLICEFHSCTFSIFTGINYFLQRVISSCCQQGSV